MGPSGTSARQATASDPARIAFARSPLGGAFEVMPVPPPWLWDIDRNGVAQHGERRPPRPGLGCRDVAVTATIHGVLPAIATALAYVAVIACPARSMID